MHVVCQRDKEVVILPVSDTIVLTARQQRNPFIYLLYLLFINLAVLVLFSALMTFNVICVTLYDI